MTMTMNEVETNEVLKVAARADKRTIAKGDIEFWQVALRGLSYTECARAVVEHYTHSTDYVMPKHIRDIVHEWRADERRSKAVVGEDNHCGRPSCTCTHTPPCDHGLVGTETGMLHCPTCHTGRRQEPGETRMQWFARLQTQDMAWERKQRKAS